MLCMIQTFQNIYLVQQILYYCRKMSIVEGGRILAEGSAAGLVRFDPRETQKVKFKKQDSKSRGLRA